MNERSDQPASSREEFHCPYCDTKEEARVVIGPVNALPAMVIVLTVGVAFIFEVIVPGGGESMGEATSRIKFKRRCRQCKGMFWERVKLGKEPLCGQCDYNLTGNVSGVCPECGWKLTRRMKTRVRLKTTAMKQ